MDRILKILLAAADCAFKCILAIAAGYAVMTALQGIIMDMQM